MCQNNSEELELLWNEWREIFSAGIPNIYANLNSPKMELDGMKKEIATYLKLQELENPVNAEKESLYQSIVSYI